VSPGGIVAIGAGGLFLLWFIGNYNRLVSLRQQIRESWSDIDVELKRRHDLIPNLVKTVKGYASFEKGVLEKVTELRNRAAGFTGSPKAMGVAETELARALKPLFAVVENYPQLKANTQYLALQKELALTEDRIAAARRLYNGNVRGYTVLRQSFPANLIAKNFGFMNHVDYFELASDAERVVPRVDLG
jgi:LemA protein